MKVLFFCPRWGSDHLSWNAFMQNAKNEGYDGIEFGVAFDSTERELDEIWNIASKYSLRLIVQHFDTYEAKFEKHILLYEQWFKKIQKYKPQFINSQTGKDFFTFEENRSLIDLSAVFGEENSIEIFHETHRNKFLFAAHIAHGYLKRMPSLKITMDVSHWVNVAESYLEDQAAAMKLAIERTNHIHARVGHTQGPQITDPRAPEWQNALNIHLLWWDDVLEQRASEGREFMTITPEFGPWPYLTHLPFTNKPIANQWEINVFMMELLKDRYKHY